MSVRLIFKYKKNVDFSKRPCYFPPLGLRVFGFLPLVWLILAGQVHRGLWFLQEVVLELHSGGLGPSLCIPTAPELAPVIQLMRTDRDGLFTWMCFPPHCETSVDRDGVLICLFLSCAQHPMAKHLLNSRGSRIRTFWDSALPILAPSCLLSLPLLGQSMCVCVNERERGGVR